MAGGATLQIRWTWMLLLVFGFSGMAVVVEVWDCASSMADSRRMYGRRRLWWAYC